ncbi:unnamed protein product [Caretta caretta]
MGERQQSTYSSEDAVPLDQKPKPGLGYPVMGTVSEVAEYWGDFFQAASFIVDNQRTLHTRGQMRLEEGSQTP